MDSQASLLRQLENPNLSHDQRAELCCQLTRELEDSGEHEAARRAMGMFWQRIGEHPQIEGLEQRTAAEVLLRAGVLTGWIGSSNQIGEAQETAKNLISEAIAIFESLGYLKKILEAQTELSLCYWRTGEYGEARIILQSVLSRLTIDNELKAKAILRSAIVEWGATKYGDALRILTDAAPLFEKINSHVIKGSYRNQLAMVFRGLATSERQEEYLDRALIEYAAASYHFEQAGHTRYRANVENNLGFLFFKLNTFKEAHEHLNCARQLAVSIKDRVHTARIDETRARVFLAQEKNVEAEKIIRNAVFMLERGGHYSILAEALITHGTALVRLGYYRQALSAFKHAIEVALQTGTLDRAVEAALTMIEEFDEHLTSDEAQAISSDFMLEEATKRYERNLVKQALSESDGSLTKAARLLGVSHQRLSYLIEKKHNLISARTPIMRRPKAKQ
jgi:tetratricopeptide (TPR) repeat protein